MFNWVNVRRGNNKKRIFVVASILVLAGAFVFSSVLLSGKNASAHDWDEHHHHHHKPDLMLAKYHFGDRWYKVGDHVTMHLVVKNRDGAGKAHHDIFVKDWIPAGLSDIHVHGHDWHCHMHKHHHHHDHDWNDGDWDGDRHHHHYHHDGDHHHHHHYHHHDGDHHHHHHKSPVTVKCKYVGGLPVDGGEVLPHIKIKGVINHHANKYFVNVAKVETRHDKNDSNNRSVETIKVRKHHHHHDHDHHKHDHHRDHDGDRDHDHHHDDWD